MQLQRGMGGPPAPNLQLSWLRGGGGPCGCAIGVGAAPALYRLRQGASSLVQALHLPFLGR